MKEIISAKRLLSVVALLLSVVMLFSACGSNKTTSSDSSTTAIDSEEELVDDGNEKTTDKKDTTSKKKKTTDKKSTTAKADGSTKFGSDYIAELKGKSDVVKKGIHVLMWRKYTPQEQKLVDDFQKKTGMKVRTTITTEASYSTKLISLISGKDSPDVLCMSSTHFPGLAVKSMQTLDKDTFNLDDSCWYKNYMDYYKVNGKYFGVSMQGTWACEDCNYVTYYFPKILKACGVTEDPWTLYKQGKWNWSKQKEIATKIKKSGSKYEGIMFQSLDVMMLSAGVDFVKFNNSQYSSTLEGSTNALLTQAWQQVATLKSDGAAADYDLNTVQQGKVGMLSSISYGLYNASTDAWFTDIPHTSADIKAVPVAGPDGKTAYTPVRPKCWGVAKGAKNVEGAAYFLRYFLDAKNIAGGIKSTCYNEQFYEVFSKITKVGDKKCIQLSGSIVDYVTSGTYSKACKDLANSTSANVTSTLNQKVKGKVATGVSRANKDLKKVK